MKYTTYWNKPYICSVKRKQRCSLPKLRTRYSKEKDEKVFFICVLAIRSLSDSNNGILMFRIGRTVGRAFSKNRSVYVLLRS